MKTKMASNDRGGDQEDELGLGGGDVQAVLNIRKLSCPLKKLEALQAYMAHRDCEHLLDEEYHAIRNADGRTAATRSVQAFANSLERKPTVTSHMRDHVLLAF